MARSRPARPTLATTLATILLALAILASACSVPPLVPGPTPTPTPTATATATATPPPTPTPDVQVLLPADDPAYTTAFEDDDVEFHRRAIEATWGVKTMTETCQLAFASAAATRETEYGDGATHSLTRSGDGPTSEEIQVGQTRCQRQGDAGWTCTPTKQAVLSAGSVIMSVLYPRSLDENLITGTRMSSQDGRLCRLYITQLLSEQKAVSAESRMCFDPATAHPLSFFLKNGDGQVTCTLTRINEPAAIELPATR